MSSSFCELSGKNHYGFQDFKKCFWNILLYCTYKDGDNLNGLTGSLESKLLRKGNRVTSVEVSKYIT
jgi:hypothetical protein